MLLMINKNKLSSFTKKYTRFGQAIGVTALLGMSLSAQAYIHSSAYFCKVPGQGVVALANTQSVGYYPTGHSVTSNALIFDENGLNVVFEYQTVVKSTDSFFESSQARGVFNSLHPDIQLTATSRVGRPGVGYFKRNFTFVRDIPPVKAGEPYSCLSYSDLS